jgi:hypothetical protein
MNISVSLETPPLRDKALIWLEVWQLELDRPFRRAVAGGEGVLECEPIRDMGLVSAPD